jgi:hypothetical protein
VHSLQTLPLSHSRSPPFRGTILEVLTLLLNQPQPLVQRDLLLRRVPLTEVEAMIATPLPGAVRCDELSTLLCLGFLAHRSKQAPSAAGAKSHASRRSKSKTIEEVEEGYDDRSMVSRNTARGGGHVARAPSLSPSDSPSNYPFNKKRSLPPQSAKSVSQVNGQPPPPPAPQARDPSPVRSAASQSSDCFFSPCA